MKRYQLVRWFPEWQGFFFTRFNPDYDISLIYEWSLSLGFWEIRKWAQIGESSPAGGR